MLEERIIFINNDDVIQSAVWDVRPALQGWKRLNLHQVPQSSQLQSRGLRGPLWTPRTGRPPRTPRLPRTQRGRLWQKKIKDFLLLTANKKKLKKTAIKVLLHHDHHHHHHDEMRMFNMMTDWSSCAAPTGSIIKAQGELPADWLWRVWVFPVTSSCLINNSIILIFNQQDN